MVPTPSPAQEPARASRHLAVPEGAQCWPHVGGNLPPDVFKVAIEQAAILTDPLAIIRQATKYLCLNALIQHMDVLSKA